MRLFVALALPEGVQEQLRLISCGVPGARWAREHHLTLCFIGEADGNGLKTIQEALASVRCPPFLLRLKGIGFFPPRGTPHTLWAGVEQSDALLFLHKRIESVLKRIGLEPEERQFVPHVTLARLKEASASKVGCYMVRHSLFAVPPFAADAFRLYRSVIGPEGSKYFVEAEYPLTA